MTIPFLEDNDQTQARQEHLTKLRELVGNVYPSKFERSGVTGAEDTITGIVNYEPIKKFVPPVGAHDSPTQEQRDADNAELNKFRVAIAGRIATPPRVMGKAAFVHLSDGQNRLQIYVRKQDVRAISNDDYQPIADENAGWELIKLLDHGDFIGVTGFLFITKTGELSVHVETLQFLAKAMMPMPDKVHGINDPELQRRYRYADLIADSLKIKTPEELEHERESGARELTVRQVFETRARLISGMRSYLDTRQFIEVETPMLTPKATGAAARAFETHHNALDIKLYARIAPELYLKRLLVGGFERVYELNRNFRNEGLSQRHNPEFTMLEFYAAYWDAEKMMDFAETMIKDSVQKATGGLKVKYRENPTDYIHFSDFYRFSMKESVLKYVPSEFERITLEEFKPSYLDDKVMLKAISRLFKYVTKGHVVSGKGLALAGIFEDFGSYDNFLKFVKERTGQEYENIEIQGLLITWFWNEVILPLTKNESLKNDENENLRLLVNIFENGVESHLIQPTFITDFPKAVSPLSKASPQNSQIAERFELFINGMECANGFSELNAPDEQYERFLDQANQRASGDDEAMVLDEDYIRALSYGMPPAAGIGIGIDRLTMLLTNRHSIRDVILFPHLRPEKPNAEE